MKNIKSALSKVNLKGGFISNIASTMIGILLTIGVGALYEQHQDKHLAREMMFNIVKSAKDNGEGFEKIDSICAIQYNALYKIVGYNVFYDGDLSKVDPDSLSNYLDQSFIITTFLISRSKTENYFYSAQTMHQISNPELYTKFAEFIENDRQIYEMIDDMISKGASVHRSIVAKQLCERKSMVQAVMEVVQDHSLYDYFSSIKKVMQPFYAKFFTDATEDLLKAMGATQEEFDEYLKSVEQGEDSDSICH